MTTIQQSDIHHIAELARLRLTEDEVALFATQLTSILSYVEKLNECATDDVEPTRQVTDKVNGGRADTMVPSTDVVAILANAPETENGGWKVPQILQE